MRLPRVLTETVGTAQRHEVEGHTLGEALDDLFMAEPRLKNHIVDEAGQIRPHVLIFVDAARAAFDTPIDAGSEIQVLQAVSGG